MKAADKLVDWAKFESKRFEILQTNTRLLQKEVKDMEDYSKRIKNLVQRRKSSNKSKQMISVVQELNRHSRLEETIQGKTRISKC